MTLLPKRSLRALKPKQQKTRKKSPAPGKSGRKSGRKSISKRGGGYSTPNNNSSQNTIHLENAQTYHEICQYFISLLDIRYKELNTTANRQINPTANRYLEIIYETILINFFRKIFRFLDPTEEKATEPYIDDIREVVDIEPIYDNKSSESNLSLFKPSIPDILIKYPKIIPASLHNVMIEIFEHTIDKEGQLQFKDIPLPDDLLAKLPDDLLVKLPDDLLAKLPDDLLAKLPEDVRTKVTIRNLTAGELYKSLFPPDKYPKL